MMFDVDVIECDVFVVIVCDGIVDIVFVSVCYGVDY